MQSAYSIGIRSSRIVSHITSLIQLAITAADWSKGGVTMKRVKAACILQTLVFMQKEDCGLSRNSILETNRREVENYKKTLERTRTRYQILSEEEQ